MNAIRKLSVYALVIALPILASAQDGLGKYNQMIADKWTNESVPEQLQSRRAGEEVLYSGDLLPEKDAKEIVRADATPVTRRISELANQKAYTSLQRQIKSKRLVDLIKAGKLEPVTYQVGNNSEETSLIGVYLELHTAKYPKPFSWGDTELHFDYSILDRHDYLINPYWDFGVFGPLTASAEINLARVAFYVERFLTNQEQNEIVYLNPIPFSAINKIVVRTGQRKAILEKINAKRLKCPQAGGCEALIIER